MTRWIGFFIALTCVGGVVVAVWSNAMKSYVHRYRMEVVVSVDGVERVGNSVVEVTWTRQPKFLGPVPDFSPIVRGEATIVDLTEKRLLAALLGPAASSDRPVAPFYLAMRAYDLPIDFKSIPAVEKQRGTRELKGPLLPALVLFADGNDPTSGRVVRPSSEGTLAPGVVLKRISLEIVDAPVTRKIDRVLPWWLQTNRPSLIALLAWQGGTLSETVEPEALFERK
jgi:hypothetical protein